MAQPEELERPPGAKDPFDVFAGADAQIGLDLAAVDWTATALGAPDTWPQSLRTAVGILLSSRFSMWMAWGEDLTFFCNAAYQRDTLGRKYPWALGRSARQVWAEIWPEIGPRIETVLATGKATWDEALLLFLERSGYSEETYHTFSYSPLRDDDGAVVGMLCVVSEETSRVIGERRMAMLRDLGSDPSVVRTEQEVLAFAARQLDRNQQDLPFTLTYLFDDRGDAHLAATTGIPDGHPLAPARLMNDDPNKPWPISALAQSQPTLVELHRAASAQVPTGAWPRPPTQALVVPLLRQGGAPYGFLVAALNPYRPLDERYRGFIELTAGHLAAGIAGARSYQAQQRRAEELAELDRAKTTFFANISHEFRTPLTLIMGPVAELRERPADVEAVEQLETIERNALRLGKLVNTLLDFSRIEAGRMQARYAPVDLVAVTGELASIFRSAIERAGLEFEVDCSPLRQPVYLDPGMWEKVILNLLSNALKFTFDGAIRVCVRAEGDHAVVSVADSGVGVPEDEIPRLFERFHRIENTRARSNEGSGIGLALVKELIALHGGSITADSRLGEGTTFTIRLPFGNAHLPADSLASAHVAGGVSENADPFLHEALRWLPAADEDTAQPNAPVEQAHRDPSARVLIADDNADMRAYLTRLLRGAGHEVTAVGDGNSALEYARARNPDLIISDVMMPGLDGLALVAALRADARTAGVPVLLLSARAGQEASIEGLHAGADDYLVKPFLAADLLARVRTNVELARLRTHQARWRSALIDSLQEAFFVTDEHGAVVEINSAFELILGYGPEGLPYLPPHPWAPDPQRDPEAHQVVAETAAALANHERGNFTVPVTHRDGHRVWVQAAFSQVYDPDTGRQVSVGTFRDVTAEHYAIQRESAVAALSVRLAQATSMSQALTGALEELRSLWNARRALSVLFTATEPPTLTATDPDLEWATLAPEQRAALEALRADAGLTAREQGDGAGLLLQHPQGPMALWLELGGDRPFTGEDQTLLTVLAGHLAQALARAHQIDQQRQTALALQRAILGPADLPSGFAVRYEPAARPLQVGGDWYDAVPLTDGRIAVVVGDCVGRGLSAATVMGQLRSAARALLLRDPRPQRVLSDLDAFAHRLPAAVCSTVFCAVIDPRTSTLSYSSAGHPPPILVDAHGEHQLLSGAQSVPLAITRRDNRERPLASIALSPGATLMLYTDGLIERRHELIDHGIDAAAHLLARHYASHPDHIADALMSELVPATGFEDDVAVLIYRHPPSPLRVSLPARPESLSTIRSRLRDWLPAAAIGSQLGADVLIAVGEATANAVEHATRQPRSMGRAGGQSTDPRTPVNVTVTACVTNTELALTIADTGSWRPPSRVPSDRGRGIPFMRALMDRVEINLSEHGTRITLTKELNQ